MTTKRYTEAQGIALARRLVAALDAPAERARRVLSTLMRARLSHVVIASHSSQDVEQATEQELGEWQQALKATLAWIVQARDQGWRLVSTVTGQPVVTAPTAVIGGEVRVQISTADASVTLSGPPLDMLVTQLYALVGLVRRRLRRCDCGQIFVRTGKRQFCSSRCQKRIYMRRFRAGVVGTE